MSIWSEILLRSQLPECESIKNHLCAFLGATSIINVDNYYTDIVDLQVKEDSISLQIIEEQPIEIIVKC